MGNCPSYKSSKLDTKSCINLIIVIVIKIISSSIAELGMKTDKVCVLGYGISDIFACVCSFSHIIMIWGLCD